VIFARRREAIFVLLKSKSSIPLFAEPFIIPLGRHSLRRVLQGLAANRAIISLTGCFMPDSDSWGQPLRIIFPTTCIMHISSTLFTSQEYL
jgi:hypothetical protein